MALIDKFITLNEGETELCRLEGNAYTLSSNPIVRFIMFFVKIVAFLTGTIARVVVVCTSDRVIVVETQKILWFFNYSVSARDIFPRAVSQVGYAMQRSLIIFKTHYLTVAATGSVATEIFSSRNGEDRVHKMTVAVKSMKEKTTGGA